MSNLFLVLDIGTSYLKCACADSEYNIIAGYQRDFPMELDERFAEIDFKLFFDETMELLKECLTDKKVKRSGVKALLITSQAQTFAPVDANFNPLCEGIVWLDERAEKEADFLHEQLPDFAKSSGFSRPLPAQYVSKLLWLKLKNSTVFDKAHAFPLINEYLVYHLTGKFYSDCTSSGMSGIYDFRHNAISIDILNLLGLTESYFPIVEKAAFRGENISPHIQKEWKLNHGFPVYLCGNDQGASACGAGLKKPGDLSINFGTAMVFYTITESLITDLTENQIAGKHPLGNDYFLLNVEGDFGIQICMLKGNYFQKGSYDQLFQTYIDYPLVDEKKPLSEEDNMDFISHLDSHQLCAGIIRYYLNRLKIHYVQICKTIDVENIFISGGMTQSKVWISILSKTLKEPFSINSRANAGIFGAIEIYNHNNKKNNYD